MTEFRQRKEDERERERLVRNAPHLGYVTRKVRGAGDIFGDDYVFITPTVPAQVEAIILHLIRHAFCQNFEV